MPYSGVPKEKTKQMESCVASMLNKKDFRKKYKSHDEAKSHAIAICHSAIVKKKK